MASMLFDCHLITRTLKTAHSCSTTLILQMKPSGASRQEMSGDCERRQTRHSSLAGCARLTRNRLDENDGGGLWFNAKVNEDQIIASWRKLSALLCNCGMYAWRLNPMQSCTRGRGRP